MITLNPLARRGLLPLAFVLLVIAACCVERSWGQVPVGQWQVSGAAVPSSLTFLVARQGRTLNTSASLDFLVISNTDTAAHTVTVQDGQGSPFILLNAYTIPASTTWFMPLGSTVFVSGIKWSASSTMVMGTAVGH